MAVAEDASEEWSRQSSTRVLLVAPYSSLGGGIGRLMSYLADRKDQHFSYQLIESRGSGFSLGSGWPMLKACWAIWRQAQMPGSVIVHLNMAERGSVLRKGALLLWARSLGLPTVLHLHAAEIVPFYNRLPSIGKKALAKLFRSAGVCVVLGEYWRKWLTQTLAVDPLRIEILRNGVPTPTMVPFHTSGTGCLLVFLGNLLPRKGVRDLLTALATEPLASRSWQLVFAGGGDADSLHEYAQVLGIADRVSFTGWLEREESVALLARASALVLPSYYEGLPLVLIEASSLGVVSVTTNIGAISEVFQDDKTALIVTPGDIPALASAILRVIDEPALRNRIGRSAKKLFESSLTIEAFAKSLTTIYKQHCFGAYARRAQDVVDYAA